MGEQRGISDERVVAATGRTHEAWFELLDGVDATALSHKEIARHLSTEHGVADWWAQHLTVAYEQVRGMRAKHQDAGGFSISKSKTLAVGIDEAHRAVVDDDLRARWLDVELEITSGTPPRTVNGRLAGGPERLTVGLTAKGEAKTLLSIEHRKLPDTESAEAAKAAWGERLDRLKDVVSGTPS